MRQRDRWVTWMPLPGRVPKPYWLLNPWIGKNMGDPANWCNWERAKATVYRRGFMLGDGIGMVTVPDCVERGKVDARVLAAVDSYAQVAWNGTDVQVLGWLPDTPAQWTTWNGLRAQIAAGDGYWIPLTGERVGAVHTLRDL